MDDPMDIDSSGYDPNYAPAYEQMKSSLGKRSLTQYASQQEDVEYGLYAPGIGSTPEKERMERLEAIRRFREDPQHINPATGQFSLGIAARLIDQQDAAFAEQVKRDPASAPQLRAAIQRAHGNLKQTPKARLSPDKRNEILTFQPQQSTPPPKTVQNGYFARLIDAGKKLLLSAGSWYSSLLECWTTQPGNKVHPVQIGGGRKKRAITKMDVPGSYPSDTPQSARQAKSSSRTLNHELDAVSNDEAIAEVMARNLHIDPPKGAPSAEVLTMDSPPKRPKGQPSKEVLTTNSPPNRPNGRSPRNVITTGSPPNRPQAQPPIGGLTWASQKSPNRSRTMNSVAKPSDTTEAEASPVRTRIRSHYAIMWEAFKEMEIEDGCELPMDEMRAMMFDLDDSKPPRQKLQRIRDEIRNKATKEAAEEADRIQQRKQAEKTRQKAQKARAKAEKEAEKARVKAQAEKDAVEAEEAAEAERLKNKLIQPLSDPWLQQIADAMAKTGDNTPIATSVENVPLSRYDMGRVLPIGPQDTDSWLNDEAINAWFAAIVAKKNEQAGYVKSKTSVPPYATLNTTWYKKATDKGGVKNIATWSRRKNIKGENLLKVEKVLLPVNPGAHWTTIVISPKEKTIEYLDSLDHGLRTGKKHYYQLARDWIEMELGDRYVREEWRDLTTKSAQQNNMSDCGVFSCFNALAAAKGMNGETAFDATDMKMGRKMMVAVFLNGGFSGDFEL